MYEQVVLHVNLIPYKFRERGRERGLSSIPLNAVSTTTAHQQQLLLKITNKQELVKNKATAVTVEFSNEENTFLHKRDFNRINANY